MASLKAMTRSHLLSGMPCQVHLVRIASSVSLMQSAYDLAVYSVSSTAWMWR